MCISQDKIKTVSVWLPLILFTWSQLCCFISKSAQFNSNQILQQLISATNFPSNRQDKLISELSCNCVGPNTWRKTPVGAERAVCTRDLFVCYTSLLICCTALLCLDVTAVQHPNVSRRMFPPQDHFTPSYFYILKSSFTLRDDLKEHLSVWWASSHPDMMHRTCSHIFLVCLMKGYCQTN